MAKRIAEILGAKVPSNVTEEELLVILTDRGLLKDYNEICSFLKDSGRTRIDQFIYKVQSIVTRHVLSQSKYRNTDANAILDETLSIKKSLRYRSMRFGNTPGYYLSLDICSANFMALSMLYDSPIAKDWPGYLRSVMPNDVRSETGIVTQIPTSLYSSKVLRQIVLGGLDLLRYTWELVNLRQFSRICQLELPNRLAVQSDEIVIEVQSEEEADRLIALINPPEEYRIRKFTLEKIPEGMLKTLSDGTKTLMGVNREVYARVYSRVISAQKPQ